MSTFGSSVINKSGKKLAPKAPGRRRPAVANTERSSTSSNPRQQTPQTTLNPGREPSNRTSIPASHIAVGIAPHNESEIRAASQRLSRSPEVSRKIDVESGRAQKRQRLQDATDVEHHLPTPASTSHVPQETAASIIITDHNPAPNQDPTASRNDSDTQSNQCAATDHIDVQVQRGPNPSTKKVGRSKAAPRKPPPRQPRNNGAVTNNSKVIESTTTQPSGEPIVDDIAVVQNGVAIVNQSAAEPGNLAVTVQPIYAQEDTLAGEQRVAAQDYTASAEQPPAAREEGATMVDDTTSNEVQKSRVSRKPRDAVRTQARKQRAAPVASLESTETPTHEPNPDLVTADTIAVSNTNLRRKKKRATTPEEAGATEINPASITMFELTKDSHNGRKSKLEEAFQGVDWVADARRKKTAKALAMARAVVGEADVDNHAPQDVTNIEPSDEADEIIEERLSTQRGPQLKLVNGQLVVDNSSLVIDQHAETVAAAAAAVGATAPEDLEEDDLTRRITSQTWMMDNKKDPAERVQHAGKSDRWTSEQTDEFYNALRMFGTDFFIISRMFPGKTRRNVKLKFVREEKDDPSRIKKALVGEIVPMDLKTYAQATGKDESFYKDPQVLEAELQQAEQGQREELEKQRGDAEEASRKKKEEAIIRNAARAKSRQQNNKRKKLQDAAIDGGAEVLV